MSHSPKFRSAFLGTPEFAVPCLDALHQISEIKAVICQPDKPQGRGLKLTPPPVKVRAQTLSLPVFQPTKLRTGEFSSFLRSLELDLLVVVAYGRILPRDVLESSRLGAVNVHASLLPKYRGAAPITWAVVRGETETGVTLMKMDEGMDTGDMLEHFSLSILQNETAGALSARLSLLGAKAITEGLPKYLSNAYTPQKQNEGEASFAPILSKEDGLIDWTKSAQEIANHIHGMNPWPCAYTYLNNVRVKIFNAEYMHMEQSSSSKKEGTVLFADKNQVFVHTANGVLSLGNIQLEGKTKMPATTWHLGRGVQVGDRFQSDKVG